MRAQDLLREGPGLVKRSHLFFAMCKLAAAAVAAMARCIVLAQLRLFQAELLQIACLVVRTLDEHNDQKSLSRYRPPIYAWVGLLVSHSVFHNMKDEMCVASKLDVVQTGSRCLFSKVLSVSSQAQLSPHTCADFDSTFQAPRRTHAELQK